MSVTTGHLALSRDRDVHLLPYTIRVSSYHYKAQVEHQNNNWCSLGVSFHLFLFSNFFCTDVVIIIVQNYVKLLLFSLFIGINTGFSQPSDYITEVSVRKLQLLMNTVRHD